LSEVSLYLNLKRLVTQIKKTKESQSINNYSF
jgi:hypothetical protein